MCPHVAASYNNVGNSLGELGRHEEALELEQKALQLRVKFFGEEHPSVATSYNNVAITHFKVRDYKKAILHIQKSYALYNTLFHNAHPDSVNTCLYYLHFLLHINRVPQAMKILKDKMQKIKTLEKEQKVPTYMIANALDELKSFE